MSSTLASTIYVVDDHYLIVAYIQGDSTIPKEIFIYENTGNETLGEFYGTCDLSELRLQIVQDGVAIPLFGNKYVRHSAANIKVPLDQDPNAVLDVLIHHVKLLSAAYNNQSPIERFTIIP